MLRFIALRGVRAHENVKHSKRRENVIYRDRSRIVELLLQLENKQKLMQNNVETQHNRMHLLYTGSLCYVAFPMARFTCIVTSQVFVEIWMRWSIALSAAFYTGRKHLWIVFSFNSQIFSVKRPFLGRQFGVLKIQCQFDSGFIPDTGRSFFCKSYHDTRRARTRGLDSRKNKSQKWFYWSSVKSRYSI